MKMGKIIESEKSLKSALTHIGELLYLEKNDQYTLVNRKCFEGILKQNDLNSLSASIRLSRAKKLRHFRKIAKNEKLIERIKK
jgi:hypothetical protein